MFSPIFSAVFLSSTRPLTFALCLGTKVATCNVDKITKTKTRIGLKFVGRLSFHSGLNGTFKMAANCCQRMCHFGLSLPISLKPVGGITSHLGHKVILGSSIVSQTLTLG